MTLDKYQLYKYTVVLFHKDKLWTDSDPCKKIEISSSNNESDECDVSYSNLRYKPNNNEIDYTSLSGVRVSLQNKKIACFMNILILFLFALEYFFSSLQEYVLENKSQCNMNLTFYIAIISLYNDLLSAT